MKPGSPLLKIGRDPRVPLMQVYALFQGKATPEDVLTAVREGAPSPEELRSRLFLRAPLPGTVRRGHRRPEEGARLPEASREEAPTPHYMGDVARVHRDILMKEAKP